jgi:hypothetical protein
MLPTTIYREESREESRVRESDKSEIERVGNLLL